MSGEAGVPLKYLTRVNPRPSTSLNGQTAVYLPMEAIAEFAQVDVERVRPAEELAQGYSYIEDGDVAYAKVTPCFENGKGLVAQGLPGGRAFATTEITVLRPSGGINTRYLAWLLQSSDFKSRATAEMTGAGGLKRVPEAFTLGFRVPLSGVRQQKAIADFLDRETAELDEFVAESEKLITLLNERRTAVITQAVTKGLDPAASFVDTESVIFPTLPVQWRLLRLKNVAQKITDGAHISPVTEGGVYEFVSTKDLREGRIDFSSVLLTTPETYELMVRTGCKPKVGDILFSKDGTIGETVVVEGERDFVVASSLIIITPGEHVAASEFLRFAFSSITFVEQARMYVRGAGLPRISIANLSQLWLPVPPMSVQNSIVKYLEAQTAMFDEAICAAREGIALAKERRQALISAAVTGKIDVRDAA